MDSYGTKEGVKFLPIAKGTIMKLNDAKPKKDSVSKLTVGDLEKTFNNQISLYVK